MNHQIKIDCCFCHQCFSPRNISEQTVIAIDVLRATTTIIQALAIGAQAVYPLAEIEEALKLKQQMPAAILSGERKGNIIPGFQLGNSPLEFTPAQTKGRTIISCTTNGTSAICAAKGAQAIWLGAITNAAAVAHKLVQDQKKQVIFLCSGTNGNTSLDDVLGAGAMIASLLDQGASGQLSDAAQIALITYRAYQDNLLAGIQASTHGRKLMSLGYERDVLFAANLSSAQVVPYLHDDHLVI